MSNEIELNKKRVSEVGFILKDMLKVIKVVSMYPENNPLPQSLRQSFAEKLESLASDFGPIRISVERDILIYGRETVYEDKGKEENLAGLIFGAGITDFTFKDALSVEDIYKFLDAFKEYLNAPKGTADLVSLIWEAGVEQFAFMTVEDIVLAEYDESFDIQVFTERQTADADGADVDGDCDSPGYSTIFDLPADDELPEDMPVDNETPEEAPADGSTADPPMRKKAFRKGLVVGRKKARSIFFSHARHSGGMGVEEGQLIDEAEIHIDSAISTMGYDDLPPLPIQSTQPVAPNTALILNDEFRLSEEEELSVAQILELDAEFDMYESTMKILQEMLLQETEMTDFYETVSICEKILSEFIHAGELTYASGLLGFLGMMERKLRRKKPLWAERLKDAWVTAGSRERLQILSAALNGRDNIGAYELKSYLSNFNWEALGGMVDLLGETEKPAHREIIGAFLVEEGRDKIDLIAKGIHDKRPHAVRNAASVLARIGDDRAMNRLQKVLDHPDPGVRLALVDSLSDCPNDSALNLLVQTVIDPDAEVRKRTVQSIIERKGPAAFEAISSVLNDTNLSGLDQSEQQSLLAAFSVIGGDQAVGYLTRMIRRINLLGSPALSFYRKAAFEALCANQSDKAERVLVTLAGSWRPALRNMAQAALQRRREIIFGEDK